MLIKARIIEQDSGGCMDTEQYKTIEGLKLAIQIEIDGKKYYEEAADKSVNKLGKQLFEWLAGEEDKHRNRFEQIYDSIKDKRHWPKIKIESDGENRARIVFQETARGIPVESTDNDTEQKIIVKALEIEDKTFNLYNERGKTAGHVAEKNFYRALAVEERGHYLALTEYREYLIDAAGYFTIAERHSLDGG